MGPRINQSVREHVDSILGNGDEMGELIRRFNWARTPLGPVENWPASLKTATNLMLSSPCPMFIWWGRQMTLLYNDAAIPLCGSHHPNALGLAGPMLWFEVWETIEYAVGEVLTSGLPSRQSQCFIPVLRNGNIEEKSFALNYSPLTIEENRVGGVFCVCCETAVDSTDIHERADDDVFSLSSSASDSLSDKALSAIEQLRQSEQRFRLFAENGPQLILAADAEGVPRYVNPGWTQYTGLTLAETAKQECLWQVVHPDDWPALMERFNMDPATGAGYEIELRIRQAADGQFRWFVCHSVPVKDDSGKRVQWLVALTDIDDKKRAEEALQEKINELQTLMDTIPIGVFIAEDPECRMITGNPAANALLRATSGNLSKSAPASEQPTHFRVCRNGIEIPAEDLPVQRAAKGEVVRNEEVDDIFEDGTVLHTLMSAAPLHDKQGQVRGAVATVLDVTARKQAEDALRESESRFRLALRDSSILVSTTDAELRYTWIHNPHIAFKDVEVIGRRDDELLPPEKAAQIMALKQKVLTQGFGEKSDFSITIDGKEHVYSLNVEPIHFQGKGVVGVTLAALDITHRVDAEHRIKGLLEQLQAADQRKNDFLATLAHELRNPLAPIRNGLQVMKLAKDDSAIVEQCHTMMERQLGQLVRLIDDLLDISRINQGKLALRKQPTNLAEIIENAIETSRPLMESMEHDFSLILPEEPIFVEADAARIAQVVMNLLNNAAKYSDPNGNIRLTVKREGTDAVIAVADKGIGIAPDHLPNIFTMFSQIESSIERSQGGLGIGLSLVKRLVDLHSGSIEVNSDGTGKGSEFIVRLPALTQITSSPENDSPQDKQTKFDLRILVVDDDRDSADSLAMILKAMGNETSTAYDGDEAVAAWKSMRHDVVLLDIGLPKCNGYEACRRIRGEQDGKGVFIIAQTGLGQAEDRQKTVQAGFDHHLLKPVEISSLLQLLSEFAVSKKR